MMASDFDAIRARLEAFVADFNASDPFRGPPDSATIVHLVQMLRLEAQRLLNETWPNPTFQATWTANVMRAEVALLEILGSTIPAANLSSAPVREVLVPTPEFMPVFPAIVERARVAGGYVSSFPVDLARVLGVKGDRSRRN